MMRMKNKSLKTKIGILTNMHELKNEKRQQNLWKNEGNEGKKNNMEILMVENVMAGVPVQLKDEFWV